MSWFSFINLVFLYALLSLMAVCSLPTNGYFRGVVSDLGGLPLLILGAGRGEGALPVENDSWQFHNFKVPRPTQEMHS